MMTPVFAAVYERSSVSNSAADGIDPFIQRADNMDVILWNPPIVVMFTVGENVGTSVSNVDNSGYRVRDLSGDYSDNPYRGRTSVGVGAPPNSIAILSPKWTSSGTAYPGTESASVPLYSAQCNGSVSANLLSRDETFRLPTYTDRSLYFADPFAPAAWTIVGGGFLGQQSSEAYQGEAGVMEVAVDGGGLIDVVIQADEFNVQAEQLDGKGLITLGLTIPTMGYRYARGTG